MPDSILSNWLGNATLQRYIVANGAYLAMHTADPAPDGDLGTELSGGGYIREHLDFSSPSAKTITNLDPWTFSGLPASSVTHIALWSGLVAGNMLVSWELDSPLSIPASGQWLGTPGDLAVEI